MSVSYVPVGWTRSKMLYDGVLIAGVVGYIFGFTLLGQRWRVAMTAPDEQSLMIKAYGSCAFLLLSLVLAIGPLARLDRRFLPLLYNRRHFGVITCTVAAGHAIAVIDWYFAYSPIDPWVAIFVTEASYGQLRGFPFIPFGIVALAILLVLAATSHDFWLHFLGPPLWKALHMGVYAAYALVVMHVAFGALQSANLPGFAIVVAISVASLVTLHLLAAAREHGADRDLLRAGPTAPWLEIGPAESIPAGRGIVVHPQGGEAVAIFNDDGRFSAVSNLCAHQNGPLGEGRIIDGCITCPWHGFQYRLADGRALEPFTERIATYRLAIADRTLLLDPRPNPPGTPVAPVALPAATP